MRTAFILTFVANLLLLAVSVGISPERVAIHFGSGGDPDNWASLHINALIMAGVHALVFFSLFFSTKLTRIFSRKYINIPNKSYWIQDENWGEAETILTKEMYLFWWPFGLFMAFTVYWTIRLMTRFRVPEKELR